MNKALKNNILEIANKIKDSYHPQKIVLFGSAVRGEFEAGSDIDFLIVKNSHKPMHKRVVDVFRLLRGINREYPLDFIVFTPNELQKRLQLGDFFVKNIFEEGEIIYEPK